VYANAGHLPPLVRRASGRIESFRRPGGMPLGVLPDTRYEAGRLALERGDALVLLSDGIPDALGPDGTRFESARVLETLERGPADPEPLVGGLLAATAAFTGNRPQEDDQTLLAIALG
jgi:sigma-B regulation protein RsbU (phosphoserine phosphatase)